jgi:hypothetical protein
MTTIMTTSMTSEETYDNISLVVKWLLKLNAKVDFYNESIMIEIPEGADFIDLKFLVMSLKRDFGIPERLIFVTTPIDPNKECIRLFINLDDVIYPTKKLTGLTLEPLILKVHVHKEEANDVAA